MIENLGVGDGVAGLRHLRLLLFGCQIEYIELTSAREYVDVVLLGERYFCSYST